MSNCWVCGAAQMVPWGEKNGHMLLRCNNCNYIGVYPTPSKAELDKAYSKDFFDTNYNFKKETEIYNQRAKQYVNDRDLLKKFIKFGMILDYGCGNGEFLSGTDYCVYGYEPNPAAVQFANRHAIMIDPASVPDNFFNGIVMRGVIEHLVNPLSVVRELVSKLLRGGIFFIAATPNSDSPAMLVYGTGWRLVTPPYHLHYFNPRNLALMFAMEGCALVHIEYPYCNTPYQKDNDGVNFVNDSKMYWSLGAQGEAPAYPGSMMSLVFRKL